MAHRSFPLTPPRLLFWLLTSLWFGLAASAAAQAPVSPRTSGLLVAREAFADALLSGQDPHPDQPAWSDAYQAAADAVADARTGEGTQALKEALGLSARVYSYIGWHSRAFAAYDEFLVEGGELSDSPVASPVDGEPLPSDLESFVTSANQLGFARYQAGDMQGASGYYLSILDVHPDEPEALRWLGRIAFERGDTEGARIAANYFARLVELDPTDESAGYFLALSEERQAVGVDASEAFRAGIAQYGSGDLSGALESFEAALTTAPDYVEADVWAGRTALELGLPELALAHWQRVVEARPDDQGAAWFQAFAQTQVRWGNEAGRAYYDGLAAYEAGDLTSATTSFVAATEANPQFTDAWVWAARSLQEDGRPLDSIPYWEEAVELEPDDERAHWYLARARTALDHGEVAGPAYYDALARYQSGEAEAALALLETALTAEPGFTEAWGLRGRIAFQQERYDVAAEAYERAQQLEPENDDYAFFAREARMLSGAEERPPRPVGDEP